MKRIILIFTLTIWVGASYCQESEPTPPIVTTLMKNSDPVGIGFSIGGAIFGYLDSKKKDKQLAHISNLLSQHNSKLETVIVKIDELGLKIKEDLRNEMNLYVKSELFGHIKRYKNNYKGYRRNNSRSMDKAWQHHDDLHLQTQKSMEHGTAHFQFIGTAMIVHHDLLYWSGKREENSVKKEIFRSYSEYFDKVIQEINIALSPLENKLTKFSDNAISWVVKEARNGKWFKSHYGLKIIEKNRIYTIDTFSFEERPHGESHVRDINPAFDDPYIPEPFFRIGECSSKESVKKYLCESRLDEGGINYFLKVINDCNKPTIEKIQTLEYMKFQAAKFKIIADRWAENPNPDLPMN